MWITPIYDRAITDVNELKSLASAIQSVGWINATTEQKNQWLFGENKGALNFGDLNRIEGNVLFLVDWLQSDYGVDVDIDTSNPIWTQLLTPFESNINNVRDNVVALKSIPYSDPNSPIITYGNSMDYISVNNLEENLFDLYEILSKIPFTWNNCGTFSCGQGLIL